MFSSKIIFFGVEDSKLLLVVWMINVVFSIVNDCIGRERREREVETGDTQ